MLFWRLRPSSGHIFLQVIEVLLKWFVSMSSSWKLHYFFSFLLVNLREIIVSKCLTSSRFSWRKQGRYCSSLCHWLNMNIQDFSEILIYHTMWMLLLKKCSELPFLWLLFLETSPTCAMMVWFSYLMITHNLDIVPSFICIILRKSQNTRQLSFYKGQSYQKILLSKVVCISPIHLSL